MRPDEHELLLSVAKEAFRQDVARWELPEVIRASARQRDIACSTVEAARIAAAV